MNWIGLVGKACAWAGDESNVAAHSMSERIPARMIIIDFNLQRRPYGLRAPSMMSQPRPFLSQFLVM